MPIIGSLPITLTNGQENDATQVMSDLNYIVTQVNSNAQPLTAAGPTLTYGVYTPTLTSIQNVTSSVSGQVIYSQVGNTVNISGNTSVTPTGSGNFTIVDISLNVASEFTAAGDAAGSANGITYGTVGAITADQTNHVLSLSFFAKNTSGESFYWSASYVVR